MQIKKLVPLLALFAVSLSLALHDGICANIEDDAVSSALKSQTGISNNAAPGFAPTTDDTATRKAKDTLERPKQMEQELSQLEKALSADLADAGKTGSQPFSIKRIEQFGYRFFRPEAAGFAPLTDIPVGSDYLIGVGDRLTINLWGSVDAHLEIEVNRDGEIVLPKIGVIRVAGTPFGRIQERLKEALSKVYRDFQLSVSMGKLRSIKIYVVGEVANPGDYMVSSLSTLINALSVAGGPTRNGSLRTIQLMRGGKAVETIDLYDFFLKGDKSRDIRLQPGDTVFVPVIGRVAGIAGNVRRPAIFELKEEASLKDLLQLSDGIIPTGYLQRVQISRVDAHAKKVVTDVSLDPKASGTTLDSMTSAIPLKDMDVVKVFQIDTTLRGYARLEGHLIRPGDYAIKPGTKISQLLTLDDLLPEYYGAAVKLTRLYPPDLHPEVSYFNLAAALKGEPLQDIELKEFDTIHIYPRTEMEEIPTVKVRGEVQKPGEYRLFDKMTVRDLLLQAGNPKLTAYMKNTELNRINRSGESVTASSLVLNLDEVLKNNPNENILLTPYDELIVKKIPNWAENIEKYITLKGEFVFPGVYPVYRGEHLSSVIERAGGFSDKAFLKGAKLTRVLVREIQQKRMDEVLIRTEQDITKKQAELSSVAASKEELEATKAALDGLRRNLEILRAHKAEGRVIIRLAPIAELIKSPYDVEVMGGDMLEVPQSPNSVNVLGYVYNPTSMLPVDDETVGHYLDMTGGPTRDAEESEIYVIRADGSVESRQQSSALSALFGAGFLSKNVSDGDTIVVPQRIERTAWLRDIKDITTIMSQIAITAGTVLLGLK